MVQQLDGLICLQTEEVADLLRELVIASEHNNACLIAIWVEQDLAGIGYWRRYNRPTHYPHADIEKVAINYDIKVVAEVIN